MKMTESKDKEIIFLMAKDYYFCIFYVVRPQPVADLQLPWPMGFQLWRIAWIIPIIG